MPRKKNCKKPSCEEKFSGNICPSCKAVYDTAKVISPKKKKIVVDKLKVNKHPTVYIGEGLFSVQYWQANRCFVRIGSYLYDTSNDIDMCSKADCSEKRILSVRADKKFICVHIQKVMNDLSNNSVQLE